jgi:hypothetical protein
MNAWKFHCVSSKKHFLQNPHLSVVSIVFSFNGLYMLKYFYSWGKNAQRTSEEYWKPELFRKRI